MSKIEIKWIYDESDCDTCGCNFAEGAAVKIDGQEAFTLQPMASCFDGQTYYETDVFKKVLEYLGHEVETYE